MNKYINRKKIIFFNRNKLILYFTIILLIFIIFIFYNQKIFINSYFNKMAYKLSDTYNLELKTINISGIEKSTSSEINKKLKIYYNTPILLLPLKDISSDLKKLPWIENVILNTDLKNTLNITIKEFEPIGIYLSNNKSYYFDNNGNIISELKNIQESKDNLIIFSGIDSNYNAKFIKNILNKKSFTKLKMDISKVKFIKKRRWDIYLNNGIILKLSEEFPEDSIKNYLQIYKKIDEKNITKIQIIDLRDIKKTYIKYK